jgi:hypothetical protein
MRDAKLQERHRTFAWALSSALSSSEDESISASAAAASRT